MTSPAIKCRTFADMVSLVEARGRINGAVESVDRDIIKGLLNEHYIKVGTERNWWWRSFDRSISFKKPVASVSGVSSASVVENSREVVMTGLTVGESYLGKSIRFNNLGPLLRIIGYEAATNKFILEGDYLGTTDTDASFKIYQYEFALPPDYDVVKQVFIQDDILRRSGEVDYVSTLEFNRKLSAAMDVVFAPSIYTIDGRINANNSLQPLDKMVLDYDFLGGKSTDKTDKIRFLPIDPDKPRTIFINYSLNIVEMSADTDEPLMPIDNRWILVHFALYDWFKNNGQQTSAEKELRDAMHMLKEMRNEQRKTEPKPKFVVSVDRFRRQHDCDDRDEMFRAARALEYES